MSFSFFSCSLTFFSFLSPSLSCKNIMDRHATRGSTSEDYISNAERMEERKEDLLTVPLISFF